MRICKDNLDDDECELLKSILTYEAFTRSITGIENPIEQQSSTNGLNSLKKLNPILDSLSNFVILLTKRIKPLPAEITQVWGLMSVLVRVCLSKAPF